MGVNISLNNSSLLLFLDVYAPLFSPTDGRTDSFFSPPEISSFRGTLIAITLSETQEIPTPRRESIRLSHLLWSPLQQPWHTHPSTSLLLSSLFSCSWKVLQDLGSDHLPIFLFIPLSLQSFAPTSFSLPWTFRKLAGMTLTLIVLLLKNTRLFLLLLSLPLGTECGQMFHSFRSHQTPS